MPKPVLIAIDGEREALDLTTAELTRRYGADYGSLSESSAEAGEEALERLRERTVKAPACRPAASR